MPYQKWYVKITIAIHDEYTISNTTALIDSRADINCIQKGLVPTQLFY